MKKCNHLRLTIKEESTASTVHMRDRYGEWTNDSDFGNYTGTLKVECVDCGLRRTYYKQKKMPKWLQQCFKELCL